MLQVMDKHAGAETHSTEFREVVVELARTGDLEVTGVYRDSGFLGCRGAMVDPASVLHTCPAR